MRYCRLACRGQQQELEHCQGHHVTSELTVCQCLHLLPQAPEVGVCNGLLRRHSLLGLKLQQQIRRLLINNQYISCEGIGVQRWSPEEASTASRGHRCLSCITTTQHRVQFTTTPQHQQCVCVCVCTLQSAHYTPGSVIDQGLGLVPREGERLELLAGGDTRPSLFSGSA